MKPSKKHKERIKRLVKEVNGNRRKHNAQKVSVRTKNVD